MPSPRRRVKRRIPTATASATERAEQAIDHERMRRCIAQLNNPDAPDMGEPGYIDRFWRPPGAPPLPDWPTNPTKGPRS